MIKPSLSHSLNIPRISTSSGHFFPDECYRCCHCYFSLTSQGTNSCHMHLGYSWTLSFHVCSKVMTQFFSCSCVCAGWLPAVPPDPLSRLLHSAQRLQRPTLTDHNKRSHRLLFSSGLNGRHQRRAKRMIKGRPQPPSSLLATLSLVDQASLQKPAIVSIEPLDAFPGAAYNTSKPRV